MAADPFKRIYDDIAERKGEAGKTAPYTGGNGRIDRAVELLLNDPEFVSWRRDQVATTLLDVGGAIGNLGYALRHHFPTRIVVDIVEACRGPAEAKENRFVLANVDVDGLYDIRDESIDLVVALDFIEHILDPQKFVRECIRVVRPGGRVLINTPNIQYWKHLESLVCKGIFPHTSGDAEVYHGGHVAFYNEHDLKMLFWEFEGHTVHRRALKADPPPPIWLALYQPADKTALAYADLIFSCQKPL